MDKDISQERELEEPSSSSVSISPGAHKSIFDLPTEIITHIVSFLSLQDVCRLGATCHAGFSITHDEKFWELHLVKEYGVCYTRDRADIGQSMARSRERVFETTGVVQDPTMQGNR